MKYTNLIEKYITTVTAYTQLLTIITRIKVQSLDFEGRTALEKQEMQLMQNNTDFMTATELYEKVKADKSILGLILDAYKNEKEEVEQIDLNFFLERNENNIEAALQIANKLAEKGE